MKYHIRKVKTGSGNIAVQVIKYENRKRVVVKHVGSAHNKEEINILWNNAVDCISEQTKQISLFPRQEEHFISLEQCEYLGFQYTFLYETLHKLQARLGYTCFGNKLLNDLVTIRIVEPASKLRSLELIETYFNIKHRRRTLYDTLPVILKLKNKIEDLTINFAVKEFDFDFAIVFYDVTTLYFETFKADDFRKTGFSKDNKSNQPQIVVGLVVNKEGFPVAYDLFPGNTFEGHTLIPIIKDFKKRHNIKSLTVVADAAMISADNIDNLKAAKIDYIVGARLGNLQADLLSSIDKQLPRTDLANIRLSTNLGYLICDFSKKRFAKDKFELDKQIAKAKEILQHPGKTKKVKFIKTTEAKNQLNSELIDKTNILLGIKGYYTNLDEKTISSELVIKRYHELYKIEQAFRISKHDLKTRPIFHFKEDPIRLHILICFMALAVSKYVETKTNLSIQAFLSECKKITDAKLLNKINNKIIVKRVPLSVKVSTLMERLKLMSH
ncbi:MAG: IS1634 family transposase [Bacteroidetes bacterium]|nr:IS1634 family transposase [Bacteroidota bacterium]MBU1569952.1 IS1634 family transposase [Pseudomonadota bacterium]MBU2470795.1 IS1634 family transposase [Bacteroidota bacterium]